MFIVSYYCNWETLVGQQLNDMVHYILEMVHWFGEWGNNGDGGTSKTRANKKRAEWRSIIAWTWEKCSLALGNLSVTIFNLQ